MKIISMRTNNGPSVFHSRPTIVMTLDLESFTETASTDMEHFNGKLIALLSGLKSHTCSSGKPGGFVERLYCGTYMAHITEHVALELMNLCGDDVTFGKTRYAGRPGLYEVVTRFKSEDGMKACLSAAVDVVRAALQNREYDVAAEVEKIKEVMRESALGPSGQALLAAAQRRGIPVRRIGQDSLLQLGHGKNIRRVQAAVSNQTNLIAVEIAQDKFLTKKILDENFIPVPQGLVVTDKIELGKALTQLDAPYALKPYDGNHGKGVVLNLFEQGEIEEAFDLAQSYSRRVLIEEMCAGRDYRLLVVNGKLIAAAERVPPTVTGDGISTVAQLIEKINGDPRRGEGHSTFLTKI